MYQYARGRKPKYHSTISSLLLCLLAVSLWVAPATAHDEPKEMEHAEEQEEITWDRSVSFGFNLTDGNSETTLFNIGGKLSREKSKDIWRFEAAHSFGEENGATNIDRTTGIAQYKHLFTERWYAGLGLDFLRNDISDVKYRATANPVLGYFIVKNDTHRFSVEGGPSYLWEEVAGIENNYLAPRVGQRWEWQLSETAKFFEEASVIWEAENSTNYIINAEAGIEAILVDSLSIVISVIDTYDNQPAEELKRNDITTITALNYTY